MNLVKFTKSLQTTLPVAVSKLTGKTWRTVCVTKFSRQALLRDNFFYFCWNARHESFIAYAQKLRSAALALPGGVAEDVLLDWQKAGILARVRSQAQLITVSFANVVARLSRVSVAQMTREIVREVNEARFNQRQDRCVNYTCYHCKNRVHIARQCDKKNNQSRKCDSGKSGQKGNHGSREKGSQISTERVCSCVRQSQEVEHASAVRLRAMVSVGALCTAIATAARLIWLDKDWFIRMGGIFASSCESAMAADGSPINAIGTGVLRIRMWVCSFTESV